MFRLIADEIKIDDTSVALNDCIKSLIYQFDEESDQLGSDAMLRIACIILLTVAR